MNDTDDRELEIKILKQEKGIAEVKPVKADLVWYGTTTFPETEFRLGLIKDKGFLLETTCFETDPKATYTRDNDPVYKDSCVEFFADFYPEDDKGYINFEMNANGAMLCFFGRKGEKRKPVLELVTEIPRPQVRITEGSWSVSLLIPLIFISQLYGRSDFDAGSIIRGNLYKCGNETDIPHWCSWHSLAANPVNFHQPETFGKMSISSLSEADI